MRTGSNFPEVGCWDQNCGKLLDYLSIDSQRIGFVLVGDTDELSCKLWVGVPVAKVAVVESFRDGQGGAEGRRVKGSKARVERRRRRRWARLSRWKGRGEGRGWMKGRLPATTYWSPILFLLLHIRGTLLLFPLVSRWPSLFISPFANHPTSPITTPRELTIPTTFHLLPSYLPADALLTGNVSFQVVPSCFGVGHRHGDSDSLLLFSTGIFHVRILPTSRLILLRILFNWM